jgi:hypothetical protein
MDENVVLIEVLETDVEKLNIPFTMYAVVSKKNAPKVKALYLELGAKKKEMAEIYRKIDTLWKANEEKFSKP